MATDEVYMDIPAGRKHGKEFQVIRGVLDGSQK